MKDVMDSISKMLYKKALGYKVKENVEEFIVEEGYDKPRLVKRKVTTKHIAPDISAAKTLLAMQVPSDNIDLLTDGQLEEEKSRLLKLLSANAEKESGDASDKGEV
ncbi:MAG: hypothetical protein IKV38_00095 [Clostridia bacterium]|nr:hypothetical protein [Clostridia bacterium]